jgi:hypothetical protein
MAIKECDLLSNTWAFLRESGERIAPVLRFLPNGTVGGYIHPSERCWTLVDNRLRFQNVSGQTTTELVAVSFDQCGPTRFEGRSRVDPSVVHVLERTAMPTARDFGQSCSDDVPQFRIADTVKQTRRRNLVVLRANAQSLHTQWAANVAEEDRNWDLCISWYGRELPDNLTGWEYFTHQPDDRKFSGIYKLFLEGSPLLDYENIYLPDDDLMMTWSDINKLFNIFRIGGFDIAQPSLVPTSFVTHPVTAQNPEYLVRYTSFVELMCPVFTRAFLKVCLPTFEASFSGFGLDHIWSQLAGRIPGRIAIIDDIAVAHTRPANKNYDVGAAIREEHAISRLYGSSKSYETFGGIRRQYKFG